MDFIIVMDSCGEQTEAMKADERVVRASLTLQVDDYFVTDDENFDQADFLKRVAESPNCPKSACPSPDIFKEAFEKSENRAYAVTLSAELSGSYNSAMLAKELVLEDRPDMKIHVFNSRSASVGETLITKKILECEEAGMPFEKLVETVEEYIDGQNTYFVLEDMEALRKNGRLSNLKAFIATALKIKPVCAATPIGTIIQLDQARGMNKALVKMVEHLAEQIEMPEEKTVAITNCNCPARANMVKEAILSRVKVKDVIVLDTAGVSTLYAGDGGIIVVV